MKTKQILIIAIFVCSLFLGSATQAEIKPDSTITKKWKRALIIDFTTTQTAYSDSWSGGEAGNVNWVANLNGTASRRLKPWLDFQSTLKLSFGQTLSQDAETKDWSKPKKSTDLIDWENVGRFVTHGVIDPYVAFRLESQFVDASVEQKKRYFSPIKLTESAGMSHRFYEKDNDQITSRFGFALRQILSSDIVSVTDDTLYLTESNTTTDGGLESVTDVALTLSERLNYTGKLTLFKALFNSKSDELENDNWKAIDVSWENIIAASLSKVVTVNLYTQILYDKEISKKGRFKETLAIGLVYKMM